MNPNTASFSMKSFASTALFCIFALSATSAASSQLAGNAALFAQENMIRALYWGAQVFPTQFTPLLSNSINQLGWNEYQSAYGECFGTTANATCFFDDNAQIPATLMDVYINELTNAQV